ncbi:hypothetical protein [Streptomyces sp. NPDC059479]|uniref:hypothetical protein n=1 Tax=Streptomyces sp. NPDC059479 TaxID=3346848 RepID=UPI003681E65E
MTDPSTHWHGYAWLETTLQEYPRAARLPLPRDVLAEVRERLDRGGEVDWFYYSLDGRYVTRTLDICPSPRGDGCPQPP